MSGFERLDRLSLPRRARKTIASIAMNENARCRDGSRWRLDGGLSWLDLRRAVLSRSPPTFELL
jgi:hypothetical protein